MRAQAYKGHYRKGKGKVDSLGHNLIHRCNSFWVTGSRTAKCMHNRNEAICTSKPDMYVYARLCVYMYTRTRIRDVYATNTHIHIVCGHCA